MPSKSKLRLVSSVGNDVQSPQIKLRFVLLDNAIAQWNSPPVQALFPKIIGLKLDGYRELYPQGMLPIDTSDFIGTHLVICEEEGETLTPMLAWRSVSYERCLKSRLTFGSIANLSTSKADSYLPALQRIIEKADGQITHDSSWTAHPKTRETPEIKKQIRELMTTFIHFYHENWGPKQWITCGVKRFKTDQYVESLGLKPVSEYFNLYSSFDESVRMYHCGSLNQAAVDLAKTNASYWNSAIILSAVQDQKKIAA